MLGGRKKSLKEGDFVFAKQADGEYNKIIFGFVIYRAAMNDTQARIEENKK